MKQQKSQINRFLKLSNIYITFWLQNGYNSNQIRMKESIVVTMTGFVNDPQQQVYQKALMSLNIRLAPSLSEQTKVLIVNDVTTEKYKIAKNYEVPISCVSIDWLHESSKKNKIMPTSAFLIKKLFFGAHVKLVGFDQQKSKKLELKIVQNGGFARSFKNNNQLFALIKEEQEEEKISVILTTKENFACLKPYLPNISYPIVDVEWIEDSLRNKFCKFPLDYALNQSYLNSKTPIEHFPKMKKKLEAQLSVEPIDKLQNKMFEQCLIYINANVNTELALLLKKLVMVYGGFYLDELSPAVTHILTEPVTEKQFYQIKCYGALINILRVDWLIDSIYINRRMKQEDYIIRSYKVKLSSTLHLQVIPNNISFNSMTFNSFGVLGSSVPAAINNRKSISVISKANQAKQKELKPLKKFESNIFKGHSFYIDSTQKKEIQLCDLTNKIIKNGGQIFTSRAQIKKGHCFYVMKDSLEASSMIQRLKKDTRGQSQIQPVSHRWINQCITKSQFIDIIKTESFIYKPFNFKTPIHNFHKIIFQVLGHDDIMRMRLKQLYNTLGSAKNVANKVEITHCLCGQNYQLKNKYKQIKKQNSSVKFVDWNWLIQCANMGRIVDIEDYLLQKENIPSTQQSQNSNLANTLPIEHLQVQTA